MSTRPPHPSGYSPAPREPLLHQPQHPSNNAADRSQGWSDKPEIESTELDRYREIDPRFSNASDNQLRYLIRIMNERQMLRRQALLRQADVKPQEKQPSQHQASAERTTYASHLPLSITHRVQSLEKKFFEMNDRVNANTTSPSNSLPGQDYPSHLIDIEDDVDDLYDRIMTLEKTVRLSAREQPSAGYISSHDFSATDESNGTNEDRFQAHQEAIEKSAPNVNGVNRDIHRLENFLREQFDDVHDDVAFLKAKVESIYQQGKHQEHDRLASDYSSSSERQELERSVAELREDICRLTNQYDNDMVKVELEEVKHCINELAGIIEIHERGSKIRFEKWRDGMEELVDIVEGRHEQLEHEEEEYYNHEELDSQELGCEDWLTYEGRVEEEDTCELPTDAETVMERLGRQLQALDENVAALAKNTAETVEEVRQMTRKESCNALTADMNGLNGSSATGREPQVLDQLESLANGQGHIKEVLLQILTKWSAIVEEEDGENESEDNYGEGELEEINRKMQWVELEMKRKVDELIMDGQGNRFQMYMIMCLFVFIISVLLW